MYARLLRLFHLKNPAQQPPQAPGGTYHYDTHENASPPLEIAVAGCTILCGSRESVPYSKRIMSDTALLLGAAFQPPFNLLSAELSIVRKKPPSGRLFI